MKQASPKVAFLACLLVLAFVSNCVRTPPHRDIKQTQVRGRIFTLASEEGKLYEITAREHGGDQSNIVSEHVISAALSPNGKYLLYYFDPPSDPRVRDNYLVLRDLVSSEDKRIISNVDMSQLAWATDSRTFSYQSNHGIFVADLSGNSHVVYQAPHGKYNLISTSGASAGAKEMYAPFGGVKWIAPDRFVFQRFEGELPFYGDLAWNELFVEPNKTTIVQVDKPARLVNLAKKWIVRGVCPEQSLLLLGENFRQGQLYLTTANDLSKGTPRPLPSDINTVGPTSDTEARYDFTGAPFQYVQFMRPGCRLIYLKDEREKSKVTQIIYIDPSTLQQSLGGNLELHQVSNMVFDPAGKYGLIIHEEYSINWLSLVNMETGEVTHFSPRGMNTGTLRSWRLLGWIE